MNRNILSFAVLLVLSVGCAGITYTLLKNSLKKVLDEIVKLSSATSFFMRVLLITLFFSALSSALSVSFILKNDAANMEYVWKIGDGLSNVLSSQSLYALAFLTLITIIIAVLKRKNNE